MLYGLGALLTRERYPVTNDFFRRLTAKSIDE
jgi:hypothetical protein